MSSKSIRSTIKLLLFLATQTPHCLRSQGGLWDFHLAWRKPMEKRDPYPATNPSGWGDFYLSSARGRIGLPQEDEEISHIYLYTWNLFVLCFAAEPSKETHPNEFTLPAKKNSEKDSMQKGQRVFLGSIMHRTLQWDKPDNDNIKKRQSNSSRIGPRKSPFINHAMDSTPFEADELSRGQYPCLRTLIFWDEALKIIGHNDKSRKNCIYYDTPVNLRMCVCVQYTGHWYDVRHHVDRVKCPQHKHLHGLGPTTKLQAIALLYQNAWRWKMAFVLGSWSSDSLPINKSTWPQWKWNPHEDSPKTKTKVRSFRVRTYQNYPLHQVCDVSSLVLHILHLL